MKSRVLIILVGIVVALTLLAGTFSTGVIVGRAISPDRPSLLESLPPPILQTPRSDQDAIVDTGQPVDVDELFAPFWQTWDIIHDQFVDQPVDDEALMRGAIRGMLDALGDTHTGYMDPDQHRQATIPLEGEYEGIGAWVDPSGNYLTIVSPMPNSPAQEAGLKPGDEIIAVDGEDMTGIDGNLVIRRVMGPAGSTVTLTIRRASASEPFDVEVRRANIVVPSVEGEMLDGGIAYVRLYNFGDRTTQDLRRLLKELDAQNPSGLILDLRNNGGGALRTAIEVSSEFIGDGVIMYEEFGDGSREVFNANRGGLATDIPMVVLINEGTASASEIVAGAVRDHQRGLLVGTTSFGKGSVQNWIPLRDDQGAVRVTIARWLTPSEQTISEVGLEPDVHVEMTDEDIEAERDPQLEKAIELIQKD
jgi:carboxyl-terminal processing protease